MSGNIFAFRVSSLRATKKSNFTNKKSPGISSRSMERVLQLSVERNQAISLVLVLLRYEIDRVVKLVNYWLGFGVTTFNIPYSYSRYLTGTSVQWRLMH